MNHQANQTEKRNITYFRLSLWEGQMYIAHFLTIIFIIVLYLHLFLFAVDSKFNRSRALVLCAWSLKFINVFFFLHLSSVVLVCHFFFDLWECDEWCCILWQKKKPSRFVVRCTHRWSVTFIYCFNWVTVLFSFRKVLKWWNFSDLFSFLNRFDSEPALIHTDQFAFDRNSMLIARARALT